jgi:hypothetical protein
VKAVASPARSGAGTLKFRTYRLIRHPLRLSVTRSNATIGNIPTYASLRNAPARLFVLGATSLIGSFFVTLCVAQNIGLRPSRRMKSNVDAMSRINEAEVKIEGWLADPGGDATRSAIWYSHTAHFLRHLFLSYTPVAGCRL